MSPRPASIPVGILVSAGPSRRRRRFRSLDDYPPIKKEVNLPLRIGVSAAVVAAGIMLLALGVWVCRAPAFPQLVIANAPGPKIEKPAAEPARAAALPPAGALQAVFAAFTPAAVPAPPAAPQAAAQAVALSAEQPQPKPAPQPAAKPQAAAEPKCASVSQPASSLGTRITFVENPPEAFREAARDHKLVLMVHVSGNFEDQAFT